MSGKPINDLSKLCIHTVTHKPWTLEQSATKFAHAGVAGITIWRNAFEGKNLAETANWLVSLNLKVVSVCRGGFFPSINKMQRRSAIADNFIAIEEAATLGAPMLVLVCGSDARQSLYDSREQIRDGIAACLDHAEKHKVILTIEPLHPMYAGDRSAINTLKQANDMAEYFNSPFVGVAVDVYHLWWDPDLQQQIKRCGAKGNLKAFHICDWKVPTVDMLNDRGIMGEGCINVREIRGWVEEAGFTGFNEVEIFSTAHWKEDQDIYFDRIINAYRTCS